MPQVVARVGRESIDLLGSAQGALFANDLAWTPRPVFQSYVAYTPALLRANAEFLEGPSAPRYLLHDAGCIDGRLVHLTEKPVELAARAIGYSSRPGENVLDLFGGSGSTLAACEQLGRKAFLLEIDAPYCDVILERYRRLSGKELTLDGVPFAAVAEERKQ